MDLVPLLPPCFVWLCRTNVQEDCGSLLIDMVVLNMLSGPGDGSHVYEGNADILSVISCACHVTWQLAMV